MDEIQCRCCGTTLEDARKLGDMNDGYYFFETMYGDYCCEEQSCVYDYISEHDRP